MANTAVEDFTELTIPDTGGADRMHIVDDPAGSPVSKYITTRNLLKATITRDKWFSAKSDFIIRTDNGVTDITQLESTTNKVNHFAANFDTAAEENIQFEWVPERNWNAGTVTAIFYWNNTGGASAETVDWEIKGVAIGNAANLDSAFGSAIQVTDTWAAQNQIHISDATAAVTIAGATDTDYVVFNVARKVGTDDMAGDARLIGVRLTYSVTDLASS